MPEVRHGSGAGGHALRARPAHAEPAFASDRHGDHHAGDYGSSNDAVGLSTLSFLLHSVSGAPLAEHGGNQAPLFTACSAGFMQLLGRRDVKASAKALHSGPSAQTPVNPGQ